MAKLSDATEAGQTVALLAILAVGSYAVIKIGGLKLPDLSSIFGANTDTVSVSKKQLDAANAANKAMAKSATEQVAFYRKLLAQTNPGFDASGSDYNTISQTWDSSGHLIGQTQINSGIRFDQTTGFAKKGTVWGGETVS